MRLSPLHIGSEMILEPGITLPNGAIVHIIVQVRNNKRDRWQTAKMRTVWKAAERQVRTGGHRRKIDPGIMFARIRTLSTAGIARLGQTFRVTTKAKAGRDQLTRQVCAGKGMGTRVRANPMRRTGEQRQIIWLARMGDRDSIGKERASVCQRGEIGSAA